METRFQVEYQEPAPEIARLSWFNGVGIVILILVGIGSLIGLVARLNRVLDYTSGEVVTFGGWGDIYTLLFLALTVLSLAYFVIAWISSHQLSGRRYNYVAGYGLAFDEAGKVSITVFKFSFEIAKIIAGIIFWCTVGIFILLGWCFLAALGGGK